MFAAQPFRNQLVTMTLTGQQLKDALEQQWTEPKRPRILQVSRGFSYTLGQQQGRRRAHPRRDDDAERRADRSRARYRVTVNNYLADGGDGFVAFKQGTDRLTGIYDVDALYEYFRKPTARSRRAPPTASPE